MGIEDVNENFFYRGNDIVKLWEQYLKSVNAKIKFYLDSERTVDTIFNGIAQNYEVALVLNSSNCPYQNKDGHSITLCGEVKYAEATADDINSIKNKLTASIKQINSYNKNHRTKITNHIIIFPFYARQDHWNLGKVKLVFVEESLIEAHFVIYEPLGERVSDYDDHEENIKSLYNFESVKISAEKRQQNDNTSCGAITAENGKEFLKDQDDRCNLLESTYPCEAKELRLKHINEINTNDFFVAQRGNIAYKVRGEKPIDNESQIINTLRDLIQKPENDWVKQVLLGTQSEEDETARKNLNSFKKFLKDIDEKKLDFSKMLKSNDKFEEGAMDLIAKLSNIVDSSQKFSDNNFPYKKQSSMSESKTEIDKRELDTTDLEKLSIKEKDAKFQPMKEKLEKNEKCLLADFEMEREYTYTYTFPYKKQSSMSESKTEIDKRELDTTDLEKLSIKEKDAKFQPMKEKLEKNEKYLLADFEMEREYTYTYTYTYTPQGPKKILYSSPSLFELGKSNNLLFFRIDVKLLQKLNFNLDEVVDSRDNNILHYAIFQHDLDLVNAILSRAKSDHKIGKLINHRNVDGTNPLGMAFLFKDDNNLAGIEIASIFADTYEYQINNYLNNKTYMDYSCVKLIGGTNLLHNVILAASKCTSKAAKQCISKFFKILSKRMLSEQIHDESKCNPNYPTMNPGLLTTELDGHMISTSRLLEELTFSSKRVEKVCKEYFKSVLQIYKADEIDDSSGDSEDERSNSHKYKGMLLDFNEFTKESLHGHFTATTVKSNFQRTFDKYSDKYGKVPPTVWKLISTDNEFNEQKWNKFWKDINIKAEKVEASLKDAINSMVVPLFHGVPFMQSQYTNYQRRKIVEKLFEINQKLLNKFRNPNDEEKYTLTKEEKILIGIHSRTSTATVGMQSLYDMMVASKEDLERLDEVDNKLLKYFTRENFPAGFKDAMKHYIFNFSGNPIKTFWEENNDKTLPDDTIVKYRFPVIATSKATDHPIRFAIGSNVEGATRGETRMQPEYLNGHPTHRLAGLVYITLHNLSDLISERDNNHTMIDVNQGLASGNISQGKNSTRIKNQLECDFLGKMDSDRIVAVIPIIYPSIKGEKFNPKYHQSLYGISPESNKRRVVSPEKIKKDTNANPNPDIMNESRNLSGFGKMFVPSVVSMINGIVVSIAKLKKKFLCTIKENNELIAYEVGFDQGATQLSKAQISLKPGNLELMMDRLWMEVVNQLQQPEPQRPNLPINNESPAIGNSEEMKDVTSEFGAMSILE